MESFLVGSIFSMKEFIKSTVRETIKGIQRNGYFALAQNMYSLSTYLFNTYCMPGTILGQEGQDPAFIELIFQSRKTHINKDTHS